MCQAHAAPVSCQGGYIGRSFSPIMLGPELQAASRINGLRVELSSP